jgi:hypothetical protein
MTIYVDGKEPFDIQNLFDEVMHLEYGDFLIQVNDKKFLIERKTVSDFWSSLKSGRLNTQLSGCDALLIHHQESGNEYWNIDVQKLYNAINGVNKHHIVWHVFSYNHLQETLRRYEMQIADGTFGDFRLIHVKNDLPANIRILCDFDGVAEDRARRLLRKFGTLKDLFYILLSGEDDISEADWPDGVGEGTIDKMLSNLSEAYKE